VEKAQQDPHYPWFSTGVTAPLAVQLTEVGTALVDLISLASNSEVLPPNLERYFSEYSSRVKSAKGVIPNLKDPVYSALNFSTNL